MGKLENYRNEYLKLLREEINIRIQAYNKYLLSKIATIGAIFVFFIEFDAKLKEYYTLSCLTIPLMAIIYDVLLAKNIWAIRNLAKYIRKNIEKEFFDKYNFLSWETYIMRDSQRLNYNYIDVLLNSLFSILVSIIFFKYLTEKNIINWSCPEAWVITAFCVVGFILSILYFYNSTMKDKKKLKISD